MTRPMRLRYVDSNGDTQIIGELLEDQDTSIGQAQTKNTGSGEYTHLEITGNKDLLGSMPTRKTDFNKDYEEIILDVYSTSSNSYVERDRVFAEDTGKIEGDKGDYRNDQLFGLQKWVGRQKVEGIGPVNTDLEDVLVEILNNVDVPHTVQTAGTIPSVQNYTYNGNVDGAIRDILRDYPSVNVWWTGQTDANDNIIVKLEEKGAGSTVETITYPDPNYSVIEYEPEDTSIVVNRATVRGTNSNGDLIEVDTDNFTSGTLATDIQNSKDKYGERSLPPRNIGYLEDQTHAEEIAKSLLQLEAQPHLVIEVPFQEQNVLNASIDITDTRYNINDTFTVVKQRDFYADSKTEVELVFEKNLSEKRREQRKDVDEERASLFPSSQTDAGQQSFTGDTGSAPSDTNTVGGVNDGNSDTTVVGSLDNQDTGEGVGSGVGILPKDTSAISSLTIAREVPQSPSQIIAGGSVTGIYFKIDYLNFAGRSISVDYEITNTTTGTQLASGNESISDGSAIQIPFVAAGPDDGDTIEAFIETVGAGGGPVADIETASDATFFTRIDFTVQSFSTHDHTDGYDTDDDPHGHTDDIDTSDNSHGGTGDATGQHGTSGTTDSKNIDVSVEDKTDR